MKRLIIVCIIMPCMMAVSLHSMYKVYMMRDNINRMTLEIIEASESEQPDQVIARVQALCDYWGEEEIKLARYIRRNQIEVLSHSIARLPALAEYGSMSELHSELQAIRWQVEHIRRSEAFEPQNIL